MENNHGGHIPPLNWMKKKMRIDDEEQIFEMNENDVLFQLQEIVYSEDSTNDDKLRALRMIGTCLGLFSMDTSFTRS